jgi:hypothetical protein
MAQPKTAFLRLRSFAGGLNDTVPSHFVADDQLAVADEVELTRSGSVTRRSGVTRASVNPAAVSIRFGHRHTPSLNLAATEIWAFPESASNFYRSTSGTSWSAVSVSDTGSTANPTDAVSFNGKLYVAYEKNAGTDRLHCWDGTNFRRAGISTPSAPTAANTGSGSYAATVRYYKVQFYYQPASGVVTYSDLSPALTFTPSGTGTGVVVTKPTTPDTATGWRVWASADNISYFVVQAGQAVATTTFTDTTAPASYGTLFPALVAPESGAYTPPWSAKYLLVDENRLLIAGAYEATRFASRVGWSAILGTAAAAYGESGVISDDERFPPTQYLDLDSDEGGEITGMEMLNGSVYVFKRYAVYKLVRTGNADAPYRPVTISKVVGALSRRCIIAGETETGAPCLYFLSDRGPYRISPEGGVTYLGESIETLWSTVNLKPVIPPHGVYDARRAQVRWWICRTGFGSNGLYPDAQIILHLRPGSRQPAWTTTTANSRPNCCAISLMLPSDLSTRDTPLTPYGFHVAGMFSYPAVLWKFVTNQVSGDDDVDAAGAVTGVRTFVPTITTKTFSLGLGTNSGVRSVYVAVQPSASGTAVTTTLSRNFGASTVNKTQTFTDTTPRVPQKVADLALANAQYVGVTITPATQAAFTLDEIAMRVATEEPA